jgi:hypothetical protein
MTDTVRGSHKAIAHGARQIASIAHPLGQQAHRCARCQDSGSVWIVCPDAGAIKVPCECRHKSSPHLGLALADVGAAVVLAGGCAALFLLL